MKKNLAVILAGGSGERFGDQYPKQFAIIAGRTVLEPGTITCLGIGPDKEVLFHL